MARLAFATNGAAEAGKEISALQRGIATLDKCRKDKRPNTPAINRSGT